MTDETSHSPSPWEAAYASTEKLWGDDADFAIVPFLPLIPKGRALDCGLGEGGTAVWLAQLGFQVDGVDISPTAVERSLGLAKSRRVAINAVSQDLRDYAIPEGAYTLIVCNMVLQFLEPQESQAIAGKIVAGLAPGGVVIFSAFSTEDPSRQRLLETGARVLGPETYWHEKWKMPVHYFTQPEVESWFSALCLLLAGTERVLDSSHGEPHYHGIVKFTGQKP